MIFQCIGFIETTSIHDSVTVSYILLVFLIPNIQSSTFGSLPFISNEREDAVTRLYVFGLTYLIIHRLDLCQFGN